MEDTNLLNENAELLSEPTPSKNFVVRNKRKFAGFTVVIVVVVLSLFDVWYGLVYNSNMKVNSAEVSFESKDGNDATLKVQGRMASQSYLSSLSVDDTFCSMQYSNGDITSSWQDLARVKGTVATKSRSGFELTIGLSEVSYSPLRHLLSDAYWNDPTGLAVQCHAGVTLYLYRVIPVHLYTDIAVTITTPTEDAIHLKYSSSGVSGTGAFKFSDEVDLAREDDKKKTLRVRTMLHWIERRLGPIQKWISKHLKHVYETQMVGIHSSFKNKFDTTEYADSFIVKVPELSVATTLLGDKEDSGRYVLSSTPFQLQFSAEEVAVDVDFSLQCSDSFDPNAPDSTELHACSLFDAKGGSALWDSLNAGLLSIAMDSASKRNFLTELAGPHHSLIGETVDMADVEAKINALAEKEGSSASASAVHFNANDLIGNELTTIQDPRISTGGKCVAGNADNIYDSYTCAIIEKGFFKVYLYVVDEDGLLSKIQILTSWAPSAPYASATQASVIARGGYVGQLNATISELFQNASMSARVDEDGYVALRSEAVASWDLLNPVESGMVNFIGYLETTADRAEMSTGLTYGDHAYSTYLNAKYNSSTDGPNAARLSAEGGYGGNYYNWHLSVDNADLFANADKVGDANAYVSSTVSTTGDAANFQFNLAANDGNEVEQLFTQNSIVWNSPDEFWTSSGLIKIDSLTNIINTIDWNADAALSYAESAYSFVVRDVSADESSDIFLTEGSGNYGGNWNNWWADLAESSVTINDGLVGNATGAISATVSSTGDAAVITFVTQAVDAFAVEQFFTSNNATWSSSSFWTEAGSLAANSVLRLVTPALYWNAHGDFNYGDNAFVGKANEYDASGYENFLVDAVGAYGGSWTRWWARLDSGALYLSETKVGSAEGEVYSTVEVDGTSGYVTLAGSVSDGSDNQILRTYEAADWYSSSWDWLESGRLSAISQFNYPSFAYWNTTGLFTYGDHTYTVNATDMSANYVDKIFDLYGIGEYGGDWNNWWASLTDSFVFLEGSKVGAIVGDISSKITPGGSTADFSFSTTVTDGYGIQQVKTQDNLKWESPDGNWLSSGDIEVKSMFDLIDSSVNWNADGSFSYGDNQYSIFLEDYTTSDEAVFKADATGLYHGTWTDFSATVTLGELYISGALYGNLVGNFGSAVSASGDAADIVLFAVVRDGNYNEQLFTNSSIAWSSPSTWTQAGHMAASSGFRLINTISFNADGSLQYSDHQYSFIVQEHQFDGFTDFLAGGSGRYGGNWNAFWASLIESTLVVSESLIGSATGLFSSEVTSNFDTGLVYFTALGFDASEIVQFSTNNTATWESPIYDWVTQGNISVTSATQVADLVDWDASAQGSFNAGTYTITIADNDLDGTAVFLTQGVGTYGGTYGNWHVSVDESVCYIYDTKQGQANGKIAWLNVDWFNIANLEVRANVTNGWDEPLVSTDNLLAWYNLGYYPGFKDFAQGVIQSTTAIDGEEALYFVSAFTLDQTDKNATFVVYDRYQGENGLAISSRAFYDERFGMLTGIDATVAYADDLIFQAHTSWDAQLQTADFTPTPQPTESPSEEPTAAPTETPTDAPTDAPTESPTAAPTEIPTETPTADPTTSPTADPTVQPGAPTAFPTAQPSNPTASPTSRAPTKAPTTAPTSGSTRAPTRTPTRAPSAVPTKQTSPILSFVSNITLGGVTAPTLDYLSQQAMISVTASSMGLSSNTVTYKGSHATASSGRRFLKEQKKSVFVTTYTVLTNMGVSVPLDSTSSSSTTDLYNSLTSQLKTAVDTNAFTNNLQQVSSDLGATETSTATANSVTSGPPESVNAASSGGGSDGLSAGAIAGIVIGSVAGLAIIVALVWFFVVQGGSTNAGSAFAPGGARSASAASSSSQNTAGSGQRGSTISTGSRSPKKGEATGQDKVFSTENPLSSKKHNYVGDDNL